MIADVTHRELPASGRGCFAAVVIAPIAAFAGLTALTTLLISHDEPAAGPSFGLPHITRASETVPLDSPATDETPGSTIAERPLALRKPDITGTATPTTTTSVTVPSTVVVTATMSTPGTARTTAAATTTTTTTPKPPPSTTTVVVVTTTVTATTTTAATTTSPNGTTTPKRVTTRKRPHR